MDQSSLRDKGFEVDLESGLVVSDEDLSTTSVSGSKRQAKTLVSKFCGGFVDDGMSCCDLSSNGVSPESVEVATNKISEGEGTPDQAGKKVVKEKRKKTSNKKAPKPPRPPRGPSLDAADQKLIREISELAMLKRARTERMKALKKMKAAKASSSSSNLFAMVFTFLFCLVIIFQGISSRSSPENFQGPPISGGATEGGSLISVQIYPNPSASISNGPGSESPNIVEQVAGSDPPEKLRRFAV
ncbi:hypothetical protein UlMin_009206 [Ulmus minor]